MILYTKTPSPLGQILIFSNEKALVRLCFAQNCPDRAFLAAQEIKLKADQPPILSQACEYLKQYFQGSTVSCKLPLEPQLTPYQSRVLKAVQQIPYGLTTSYAKLATALRSEKTKACAQAVGGALRRNPLLIIIPCHRVTGADGILRGYAGGMERQRFLLKLESSAYASGR